MPVAALPRIPSLDGLRAVSIAFVIAFHLMGDKALGGRSGGLGNLGVRVFFVISGYLITRLLLEELNATSRISLRDFYIRRALRIFPAFYVFLLFIAVCAGVGWIALLPHDLQRAGTYTINYFPGPTQSVYVRHAWSLSVEEQFYLLWPSILFLTGRRKALVIAGLALLAVPAIRLLYWFAVPSLHDVMDRRFETVADTLATGCLLAGVQGWLSKQTSYNRVITSPLFLLLPPILVLVALYAGERPRFNYGAAQTFLNTGIAAFIDRGVRYPALAGGPFLNWKPVRFVGVLSYSLYLWQQPFLDHDNTALYARYPWNLLCTAGFSLFSYYVVEKKFLKLRSHFHRGPVHVDAR
jgi:peptidoglycan/LPS O-acetylase OafA/YrhL